MSKAHFIGRQTELDALNTLLTKRTASLVVVKGRRRIGKSRLLEEFCQDKKAYFFRGLAPHTGITAQMQRDEFVRQLTQLTSLPEIQVDDWSKLFILLAREVGQNQAVIVFDEISWMGSEDPTFMSKFKDAWEQSFKKNNKLILVLCGSISTWIDEHIINHTGFYGRITWTISLKELPLKEANELLTLNGFKGSVYERFKLLAVTGGVPWYLEQMQGNYSADENIKRHCFTQGGVLVDEYDRIFKELFGKRDLLYKKIINELTMDKLSYEALTKKTQYKSSGRFSEYLDNLVAAGFITREYTWHLKSGKQSSKSQFRLSDNYMRFYLKYIAPKRHQIEKGQFKTIAMSTFPGWESIMGLQFENLVLNNRNSLLSILNIREEDILYDNPFFQPATKINKGVQIDYLIETKYKNFYLIEIKFSKNPVSSKVIEKVTQKIERLSIPKGVAVLPVLIQVNGVSDSLIEKDYFYSIIDFTQFLD